MGAFQTAGRPAYAVGPRKEGPAGAEGGPRFSFGKPDLVKIVGIVGAIGLGGYYLWSSGSPGDRRGASTPPEPVPPPSSPQPSPTHPRYCTKFKYFYAPPCTEIHPQQVRRRSRRSRRTHPPPSSPPTPVPPLPPPPPHGILRGTEKDQGADRPRPRVTFDLPPEDPQGEAMAGPSTAGGLGTDTTPPHNTDDSPPQSSRQDESSTDSEDSDSGRMSEEQRPFEPFRLWKPIPAEEALERFLDSVRKQSGRK